MANIHRFGNADAWADAAANALGLEILQALDSRPDILVAIAGGRTPGAILQRLQLPMDLWPRIRVTPTDERMVPRGSDARNDARLSLWLNAALRAGARLWSLEDLDPPRAPDAVLLGLGADRHIASLFPSGEGMVAATDADAADLRAEVTPAPLPPEAPHARITFTMHALLAPRRVVIAALGDDKLDALDAALEEKPARTPLAVLLAQYRTPVDVFVCADPA